MTHINFDRLDEQRDALRREFDESQPYEHVSIDDFLHRASFEAILRAIPAPIANQKSSDYIFAKNKFENPRFDEANAIFLELRGELTSTRFAEFLSQILRKEVFVDFSFVGGGLHQGGSGSYLDMHADFSRHPVQREWVRELNILLYLNSPYEEAWGGHLEMQHAITGHKGRVAPIGNRLVIMLTKEHTLHGYQPIAFPEGQFRTSIASYAYSIDRDFERTPERSTLWRPSDGGALKRMVASAMPTLVRLKGRLLGSSTAKRARRKS